MSAVCVCACCFSPILILCFQNKYKAHSKKQLPHGSYTTLPETRDTAHVKQVTKNVSEVSNYCNTNLWWSY